MRRALIWFAVLTAPVWLARLLGCAPAHDPEYPRHDCRVGAEFTYYSDDSWAATGKSECGKAF